MQDDTLFCSICGKQSQSLRGCCTIHPDVLADSIPAPAWSDISFAQQCLIYSLVRYEGEAREAEITRDVCCTGAERRECVRDTDPARGHTNLILRSPHGPLGITRRYYLTDAGLATFESNPDLIKADLGRIKKLRRLREKGSPSRLTMSAIADISTEDGQPDWITPAPPAEIVEYHDELEEHEAFDDLREAA